jgi:hypothetical protein
MAVMVAALDDDAAVIGAHDAGMANAVTLSLAQRLAGEATTAVMMTVATVVVMAGRTELDAEADIRAARGGGRGGAGNGAERDQKGNACLGDEVGHGLSP